MNTTTAPSEPTPMSHLIAAALRRIADSLHQNTPPPTRAQIAREQLHAAQVALLEAEAEAERWTHTVSMLRERVARLGSE